MSSQITGIYYSSEPTALNNAESATFRLNSKKVLLVDSSKTPAASSTSSGTVAVDTTAGGTQVVAANTARRFTQCQNNGAADVYFGTGTVTSSFLKI